jgi:hypothetical protein
VVNLKDSYKDYKEEVDYNTYKKVIYAMYDIMMDNMMNKGIVYKLPHNIGVIGCFQRTTYGRGVMDFKLHKETGIKRYIKNYHSEERVIVFNLDTSYHSGITNQFRKLYKFTASRSRKRQLASIIKSKVDICTYNNLDE